MSSDRDCFCDRRRTSDNRYRLTALPFREGGGVEVGVRTALLGVAQVWGRVLLPFAETEEVAITMLPLLCC